VIPGPITLWADYACPFAQRVEALLNDHGQTYQTHVVDHACKPEGLLQLSPTGRLPLVTIGTLKLYETGVVADYLSEQLAWGDAYPSESAVRAQHRMAIRRLEAAWVTSIREVTEGGLLSNVTLRLDEDLVDLDHLITHHPAHACMLTFSAVPFWHRWRWMQSNMLTRIDARPRLGSWFRAAAALPALVTTTPDAERARSVWSQFINATNVGG
jgi:hypothetical protein